MKNINDLLEFLKKNRLIIYIILGLILILQICSKGSQPIINTETITDIPAIEQPSLPNELSIPPQDESQPENEKPEIPNLWILLIVVLSLFVARRKGWLDKIYPQIFILRVVYYKRKTNGELVLKVFILNRTRKSVTIEAPSLAFFKGKEKRQFVIKNLGGQQLFPLILLPGTGHKFVISAQKFYDNVDGLSQFKTIRMLLPTQNGKTYKSTKWPVVLTWRRM
ncbi:hypothetical protein OAA06_00145 [bacterium]|nr:hypothetical protein [bacterium]